MEAEMENTSMVVCGEKFDVGCRVVLWDEPNGYSFYKFGTKYAGRNISFDNLKKDMHFIVAHHTATYNVKSTYTGIIGRGLSSNFIIEDDNNDGFATIYQLLDIKDAGYSQKGFNMNGPGVEICYWPTVKDKPQAYSDHVINTMKVQPHTKMMDKIHGVNIEAYCPTEAQMRSFAYLAQTFCATFDVPGLFPRDKDGNYLKGILKDPSFKGLACHYNLTTNEERKIDPLGFDHKFVEDTISRINNPYP
jgi:hypothetical protein